LEHWIASTFTSSQCGGRPRGGVDWNFDSVETRSDPWLWWPFPGRPWTRSAPDVPELPGEDRSLGPDSAVIGGRYGLRQVATADWW
jgi:hypothetical protein